MKKLITYSIIVLCLFLSAISAQAAITVRLDPSSVPSWSKVNLYAWTGSSSQLLGSWPGTQLTKDADGWYSYTFTDNVTSVNIIWNDGSNQTKDITNVTQSICYKLNSQSGTNIGVTTIDCPIETITPDTITPDTITPSVFFTVNFFDWDSVLLKTEQVAKGKYATPSANPTREGYNFAGWDKSFSNVQSDLDVVAQYTTEEILPTAIVFNQSPHVVMYVGDTINLSDYISFVPENATVRTLEWSWELIYQYNYFYADSTGRVIAWREGGSTTFDFEVKVPSHLVNWNYVGTTISVKIEEKVISDISLSPDTLILNAGETAKLTTSIKPENVTAKDLSWSTSNKKVATVADDGTITALKVGYTNIIAKAPDNNKIRDTTLVIVPSKYNNDFINGDSIVFDVHEYAYSADNYGVVYYLTDKFKFYFSNSFSSPVTYDATKGVCLPGGSSISISNSDRAFGGVKIYFNEDVSNINFYASQWQQIETNDPKVVAWNFVPSSAYSYFESTLSNTEQISISKIVISFSKLPTQLTAVLNAESASLWNEAYVYANCKLLDGTYRSPEWPGFKAQKDENGWWSYTFDGDVERVENLVWNCGDSTAIGIYKPYNSFTQSVAFALNQQKPDMGKYSIPMSIVNYDTYVYVETPSETTMPELPRAELWYDFTGTGEKGIVQEGEYRLETNNTLWEYIAYTYGVSKNFMQIDYITAFQDEVNHQKLKGYLYAIEDVNGDGKMDFSHESNRELDYWATISNAGEYSGTQEYKLINTNFDVNNDGRIDYLVYNGVLDHWSIMFQQADGSFEEQYMQLMSAEEYENAFDPDDPKRWGSTASKAYGRRGKVDRSANPLLANTAFIGQSLPRPPVYYDHAFMPTRVLDLNADGYMDIIDEERGILCYNCGDGKWIRVDMGCSGIIVADLNGDDIQDFVYPGSKLCAVIYRGENNFETQVLYENLQVDQDMYCYDFDRDGDVDILVTFSAPLNSTGYAYTMFFENDGDGRFTQLEEQDYGTNKLLFSNCQDLDGDGYYDMLAFRGAFETNNYREVSCSKEADLEVVWLKGLSNKTFAEPEVLFTYSPEEAKYDGGYWFYNHNYVKINVADIDNDGYMEVWFSKEKEAVANGGFDQLFTKLIDMSGVVNTAPSAPAKPELRYDNGLLTISWSNGADAQTATTDLTYALRVGSTPGGNDILHAHANADGSRRNFLDGNMGKYHTYTLDLTQRKPCMVYMSVQTIDAQYVGSAWSEEASVEHTALFADFSVSKNEVGRGVTLTATALDLGDEVTHSWTAEDGVCVGSGNVVQISFDAVGKKSITHTITLTDGTMAIANEIVNVMPNHVDTADFSGIIESSMMNMYVDVIKYGNGYYVAGINRLLADYTMDGYWDAIGAGVFVGDATSAVNAIFKGAEDYTFSRASGIWNTDLEFNSTFWYDWDHNGAADVLVETSHMASEAEYYYLPHNGTNNMLAKKSDENLAALFGSYLYSDLGDFGGYMQYVDFTHNGYYDFYAGSGKDTSSYFYTHRLDGSYQKEEIKGDVDKWLLQAALTGGRTVSSIGIECGERFYIDVNKDGFTDACVLYYDYTNRGAYTDLVVMLNKGNCQFEQLIIPFAQPLSSPRSAGGSDIYNPHLADMNNDGYIDIVAHRGYDGALYIMWNEANQRFSAPDILPLGALDDFLFEDKWKFGNSTYSITAQIDVVDIDNNGYLDVVSMQRDKSIGYSSEGNKGYGSYVYYFGAEGVIQQGFLYKHTDLDEDVILDQYNLFKLPNHEWSVLFTGFNYGGLKILPIHGTTNERPSAPEGVRAVQNGEGMLIEWSGAKDDFTPTTQMRYNLSVKKKGQTGAGAYIISPQNGANSNAAPMRNYDYITAEQYIVPLSVLPEGEYDIQVQAIDLQDDWSDFSEPITIEIQRESVLEAPTVACLKKPITLVYMGAPSTSTPEWNFDGAEVVSGSGYGPYELKWDSVGTKTISLTVDGETKTRMIYVEENGFEIDFPMVVVDNMPVTINLPKGMEATYYIADGDYWVPISEFKNIVTQKGNTLTFKAYSNSAEQGKYLGIQLVNENGCDTILGKTVYVVGQDDVPTISLVTSNADGHNVINWSETSTYNFSEVRVLKETNRYNQFVEVGIVPIYEGMYVDRSSNAAVKSERYVIEPVMGDVEIPMGTIHQTTHLTINRGMNDQTWNLIWNRYEGANVVSYNILRGASPDAMTTIATVSSNHTSYTDFALDSSEPYYAIEYVLADDVNMAPQQRRNAVRNLNSGRSNVVNSATAGKIVYAEKIAVLSANNKYETTAEKDVLLLYAELMPVATTYQQVKWEITSGSDLATIDQNGLLTARTPNNGGVVTVKATTIDGTNLFATRNITIGAIVVEENPVYYTVTFQDWDGTILKTEQVEQGQSATAPTNPTREGYTFIGWDTEFSNVQSDLLVKALYVENGSDLVYFIVGFMNWDGTILKTEQVLQGQSATPPADPVREGYTFIGWDTDFSNVQSDLLVRALYEQNTALEDIEEDATLRPRKEMIDGILYIIMPDGTKYTMQGKRVK